MDIGHKNDGLFFLGVIFSTILKIFEAINIKLVNDYLYMLVLIVTFVFTTFKCIEWIRSYKNK
jgi:uncharacterized membrane protein